MGVKKHENRRETAKLPVRNGLWESINSIMLNYAKFCSFPRIIDSLFLRMRLAWSFFAELTLIMLNYALLRSINVQIQPWLDRSTMPTGTAGTAETGKTDKLIKLRD